MFRQLFLTLALGGCAHEAPPAPMAPAEAVPADDSAHPVQADIIVIDAADDGRTVITINRGTADGVGKGWTGTVDGVEGSEFTVFKATERVSYAKVNVDF